MTYKLDAFEGPLDLLLRLIERNKVSIADIPIALIFEQYMETLDQMQRMDMEVAGEFIVMASELMLIKSRMLLPREETEAEDPRAKLAAALAEYARMKQAADYLNEQFSTFSGRVTKDTDEVKPEDGRLEPQDADALRRAMLAMMRAMDKSAVEQANRERAEQPFERILRAPIVPVSGKIFGVIRYLVKNGEALYTSILLTANTRSELIATFLAVLELIKKNRVTLRPVGDYSFETGPEDFAVTLNTGHLTGEKSKK
ncbi:MAG: segregation/condensation protein A [Clostridia bacterium]|nr:segregation/condensation protein A [Clostridia bacterium]